MRKSRGMKQKDLAGMLGITQAYLSNLLSGKREWMLNLVAKVCSIMEITVVDMFRMVELNNKKGLSVVWKTPIHVIHAWSLGSDVIISFQMTTNDKSRLNEPAWVNIGTVSQAQKILTADYNIEHVQERINMGMYESIPNEAFEILTLNAMEFITKVSKGFQPQNLLFSDQPIAHISWRT